MTEQAKVPAIRFAGFTDPWEQRKLGELTESYSGGTPAAGESEFYGGSIPFIRSAEIAAESTELFLTEKGYESSSARMVKPGDVLYALYGATSGEVAVSRQKGAINQAILAILPRDDCDARYITAWLRKQKGYIVTTYLQGGQGNLSGVIVKNLEVSIPSLPEQQKIGFMLSHLDSLITLHQRKYDKLVIFKKSMLEKMFPKDGESVPEIRFAGFTDPWEQRELVDIAEIVGGGTPDTNNSNYWDGDIDWYAPAELGNNIYAESSTRKITQAGFDSCSTKMLPADKTILFTSRAGIGNTAILRHSACTNQGFQSLVIGDADVYFVYSMSERIKKWAEEKASGSTFLEISGRQLETMPVNLPSLVEQQAIGSFFSHLDDLITLHQRKLELLQNIKKSLLDKMFA
ncbi:restriction endonuclease S subunit [Bifidobacterium longum subsp. longum]|uniref:Restriction endonuclease S subunit n=1 Tax=Bifidobacterium longum subsp. longum TaxID=1679 RepID=A0A4R0UNL5_BIFLL|nr:restriction endonuclease S subunit [Bifidobacterium longum subsp. longum]